MSYTKIELEIRRDWNAYIPEKKTLDTEFKSDLKCYPDHDLIEEIIGMS